MQQLSAPKIDESLINKRIEVLCEYFDEEDVPFYCWSKGTVDAVPTKDGQMNNKKGNKSNKKKKSVDANNIAIILWDEEYCVEGSPNRTQQKLLKSKWNKHTPGAWRFVLETKL